MNDIESPQFIFNCTMFERWIYNNNINYYKLTNDDKIIIKKLLDQVQDNLEYDYPTQKLQIYTIIMFSNFIGEGIYLDLDSDYVNSIINVILKTNIIHVLFNLL